MEIGRCGVEILGALVLAILMLLVIMLLVCDVTDDDGYWHSNL